ncbi:MAG TPA: secondary thiamine-phosphate synthase enzyme YjbQ [Kiritimatiellia bacterium]|nr:secondary thiamine-phosphate synthase enzyme YjbQ [Kiritimatiellia bacterium]HMO98441.1 secondary thiamine-phosphate synthase enzyme YjbQ [Kiritimatiellia bacterium]HMP95859.1 secondary thiamine-phosphate synthase enzyme YjbQ [Kiritimatiellia bacterium]
MKQFSLKTSGRSHFVEITREVRHAVESSGLQEGVAVVYVPHTTAGVTVNEHADPDVARDMVMMLDRMVPWDDPKYRHGEGNSAAHIKAAMMGSSAMVPIRNGRLALGTWQGIFFCEFDGPRSRDVWVRVLPADA